MTIRSKEDAAGAALMGQSGSVALILSRNTGNLPTAPYGTLQPAVRRLSRLLEPNLILYSPSSPRCCQMCCQEAQFYHENWDNFGIFSKSLILELYEYNETILGGLTKKVQCPA